MSSHFGSNTEVIIKSIPLTAAFVKALMPGKNDSGEGTLRECERQWNQTAGADPPIIKEFTAKTGTA